MSDYALIKGGVVENVIVASEEFIESIAHKWDDIVPMGDSGIGWRYEDGEFIPPEYPVVEGE